MRKFLRATFLVLALISSPSSGLPWGVEGHRAIGLIAEKYMTPSALARTGNLLDGSTIDAVASWADEYGDVHRETRPWHYIDFPLADSRIDLARECPNGDCVIAKAVRPGVKEHHFHRLDEQRPHRRGRGQKLYRNF